MESYVINARRRIHEYPEIGFDLVNRITEDLKDAGAVEAPAKLLGKNINMSFNPKGR